MSTRPQLNAMRDSFTGQVTTLSDEDRPIFDQFTLRMLAALQPRTELETFIAHSIAWDHWRLNHLRAVEMNMYAVGAQNSDVTVDCEDPRLHTAIAATATFTMESQKFALMSLCEQRLNRSLHKNMAAIQKLQADRKRSEEQDRAEEVLIARYNDINGLPYQAPAKPSPNGFVFSNNEILAAANRLTTLAVATNEINTTPPKVQFAGASAAVPSNVAGWPEKDAA